VEELRTTRPRGHDSRTVPAEGSDPILLVLIWSAKDIVGSRVLRRETPALEPSLAAAVESLTSGT
jgi:hypothetical protein